MKIKTWNTDIPGQSTEQTISSYLNDLGYNVTKYVYPPGAIFPPHSHNIDKIDVVLSGSLEMTLQGETIVLISMQYLEIPRGEVHSARVVGDEPVVSLDAVKI